MNYCFILMAALVAPHPDSEVLLLLKRMGSDSFYERELASEMLTKLAKSDTSPGALSLIKDAAKTHTDPEVKKRSREILYHYYTIRNKYGHTPGIVRINVDYLNTHFGRKIDISKETYEFHFYDVYLREAGKIFPYDHHARNYDDYQNLIYETATQLLVHELFQEGYKRKDIQGLIDFSTDHPRAADVNNEG